MISASSHGAKLGNLRPVASIALGRAKRVADAEAGKAQVMVSISDIQAAEITTAKASSEALNASGLKMVQGGVCPATQMDGRRDDPARNRAKLRAV